MRVCLVGPLTVDRSPSVVQQDLDPPLGILTLAAVLRNHAHDVSIIDPNRELTGTGGVATSHPVQYLADIVAARAPDVVGLSTICSSYPFSLLLATLLKQRRPSLPILLGGPQATATDVRTLEAFGAVDYVVRGEAETSLPELLRKLKQGSDAGEVAGVTQRTGGKIVRSQDAALVTDLDLLPEPAFDLYYPAGEHIPLLPVEIGRGCPYGCTFCSTNDFFRRRFRLRSPASFVDQVVRLREKWGTTRFDFTHDMFTVDRRRVLEFCDHLERLAPLVHWYCSGRTDRIDPLLLDRMHAAGCRGIFYGIETGSEQIQKSIAKKLSLQGARQAIRETASRGMRATASLISGFPDETEADLRQTLDFMAGCAPYENVNVQLHLLAPLAGTPLTLAHAGRLLPADDYSDISSGEQMSVEEIELVRADSALFSNFWVIASPVSRHRTAHIRSFMIAAIDRVRWLVCALADSGVNWLELFDGWTDWSRKRGQSLDLAYYTGSEFPDHFAEFVASVPSYAGQGRLTAFLWLEKQISELSRLLATEELAAKPTIEISAASKPRIAPHAALRRAPMNFRSVVNAWKSGEPVPAAEPESSWLVFSRPASKQGIVIAQLPELTAEVASRSDGNTPIESISTDISRYKPQAGPHALTLTSVAVGTLYDAGFITVA